MVNKMRFLIRLLLFLMLFPATTGTYAQNSASSLDRAYGLDPLLYNGKFYTYFLPYDIGGTQFFFGPDFVKGFANIRGIIYNKLDLNYDIYNQQVILQYETYEGARKQIVLSDAWLEKFSLGNAHFEMLALQDSIRRIYQVIGNGPYRVLYSWRKDLTLDIKYGATNYIFSEPIRKAFLFTGQKSLRYKNNKSFVALFDPVDQVDLKKHMRRQHINLKKASEREIIELLNYCNTLSLK